jgi:methionine synthase I (cobalamin-dependent)
MDLLDELEARVLCGDGAMGTRLMADGVPLERCFEELCVSAPDRIQAIHEQYIGAGACVIKTNTFGANAVRLSRFGMEDRVGEINRAAAKVAKSAGRGKNIYVAGSIGPLGIGAEEATARGIDRAQCFCDQISAILEGGVDLIFFETFMDFGEIEIALRAKNALSTLPEICSFACAPNGRLSGGMELSAAFASLRGQGAKGLGVNCMNGPRETAQLVQRLQPDYLFAGYPTAGQPTSLNGRVLYDATPEDFGRATRAMVAQGARLIGGCCGTTATHIAAIAAALGD